jgi:hypothetical protein
MRVTIRRKLVAAVGGLLLAVLRLAAQEPPPRVPPAAANPAVELNRPALPAEKAETEGESPFADSLETDRDSFTPATRLVGKHRFLLESAYSFIDNRGVKETHSFPELLLRSGLTDWLELRLGWNYEVGGASSDISSAQGESDFEGPGLVREHTLSYGFKVRVTEQREWVPASAFLFMAGTPTGGEETDTHVTGTYVFGWELPNRWKADAALRYGTGSEGGDRFGVWAPSAVLRIPIGERVNVHGEYFGLFSQDRAENFTRHYLSPGIHYLITPDLEVGIRAGWGLNDQSARFFVNAGVGWRF